MMLLGWEKLKRFLLQKYSSVEIDEKSFVLRSWWYVINHMLINDLDMNHMISFSYPFMFVIFYGTKKKKKLASKRSIFFNSIRPSSVQDDHISTKSWSKKVLSPLINYRFESLERIIGYGKIIWPFI